jgi:hypothetical protein
MSVFCILCNLLYHGHFSSKILGDIWFQLIVLSLAPNVRHIVDFFIPMFFRLAKYMYMSEMNNSAAQNDCEEVLFYVFL